MVIQVTTRTVMGIVLKRRDNAKIVKHIFGGVIDIIMEEHDIQKAMKFAKMESARLLSGSFPMDMFTITKTLKSYYKNPDQIAHNVLAQRIAQRDPGNKPQSNDRMPFAYIKTAEPKKGEKVLQGDKIESPQFIEDNNLELDYRFYLTNQVMKPVSQIFELETDDLAGIFVEALMEYDRSRTGMERVTQFASKKKNRASVQNLEAANAEEYRRIVNEDMMKLMTKVKGKDKDDWGNLKAGDEPLFSTN